MKLIGEIKASPLLKKLLRGGLVFLVMFSLAGLFILPPIVKSVALKQLSEKLKREVTIKSLKINLFCFHSRSWVLSSGSRGVQTPLHPLTSSVLISRLCQSFERGIIIKEIGLTKPCFNIERNEDFSMISLICLKMIRCNLL